MSLMFDIVAVIGAGCAFIAFLEWNESPPKAWVVRVRLWWHRRNNGR